MAAAQIDLEGLATSRMQRLVAVEPNKDGTAALYRRELDGRTVAEDVECLPWMLVSKRALTDAIPGTAEIEALEGTERFGFVVRFPNQDAYYSALRFLKSETGMAPTAPGAPYRVFSDLGMQALTALSSRLFRGLVFADLRRMQVDIETRTTPGYDFPNAARERDDITIIAMRDSSGWERCLSLAEMPEGDMLAEMVRIVCERDPDVIEGHNVFKFDLPYIQTRCRRYKVRLALGRDGSTLASRSSRFTAGERTTSYTRFDIRGRHIVDTLHLVQLYDVVHRDLESYGLKNVARYFGVAAPERTYVEGREIGRVFDSDPARLKAYAMDDVRETDSIARVLSPSHFYQTQLVPMSYQNCVTRGNATRIDALLVGEYMRKHQSIPAPEASRPFRGGLTDALQTGVFGNVWHADVRSLYPSIIITENMVPRRDALGVYHKLLTELRRFRLSAKDAARTASSPEERDHYDALQGSFKVLINSFYGYAGFPQGTFNDYDLAEAVTAKGREILTSMLTFLEAEGAAVIEMDTDGLYFVPPDGVTGPAAMEGRLQEVLPSGIDVEVDATYKAMFGYKSKNYALLDHDGKVSITGAALKSRGLEPFQRRYIRELISLLLTGRAGEVSALYERTAEDIREHQLPFADLAKREVLSTSPKTYQEKLAAGKTRRSAAYELVLRSDREYAQGDQVSFYITGEKKNVAVVDAAKLLTEADVRDENVAYYLDKLAKLHQKFAEFLPA